MPKTTNSPRNGKKIAPSKPSVNGKRHGKKTKKRIVSYSLDVDLLHQIRKVAQREDRYYSSIVSEALRSYIQEQQDNEAEV